MTFLLTLLSLFLVVPGETQRIIPSQLESIDLKLNEEDLAFTFFSLSDGEVTLIQNSEDDGVIINTGAPGTKLELKKLLSLYNVQKISTIICTDINTCTSDHLDWFISKFDVKQVIVHSGIEGYVKDQLHNNHDDVSLHIWSKGTNQMLLPNLTAKVVNIEDHPNRGMDISFSFLKHRVFYKSSFGKVSDNLIIEQNLSDVNVVKLPCYGIEGAISNKLLKHLDPQVAIIFHSKTKIPSPELLKRIHASWIDLYYTKKHGNISIKFTNGNYEVITISTEVDYK
jgi:competence protein ComEC